MLVEFGLIRSNTLKVGWRRLRSGCGTGPSVARIRPNSGRLRGRLARFRPQLWSRVGRIRGDVDRGWSEVGPMLAPIPEGKSWTKGAYSAASRAMAHAHLPCLCSSPRGEPHRMRAPTAAPSIPNATAPTSPACSVVPWRKCRRARSPARLTLRFLRQEQRLFVLRFDALRQEAQEEFIRRSSHIPTIRPRPKSLYAVVVRPRDIRAHPRGEELGASVWFAFRGASRHRG